MSTVAIDFDGPIHRYSRGWQDGSIYDEPSPGAWDAIARIQRRHAVFIFTSRDTLAVQAWLAQHAPRELGVFVSDPGERYFTGNGGGPVPFWEDRDRILVTNRKLPATAYIDDRAVHFQDWLLAQGELERLRLL